MVNFDLGCQIKVEAKAKKRHFFGSVSEASCFKIGRLELQINAEDCDCDFFSLESYSRQLLKVFMQFNQTKYISFLSVTLL